MIPQPPFTEEVHLYCPVHGDRYLRTPHDKAPFPDPAVCGYPTGWPESCAEVCTENQAVA
jgi:hypothetical protein